MIARKNGKSGIELMKLCNALDLAVIVRCKDCINWSDRFQKLFENRTVKLKYCEASERMTTPDFYCAWGVKRGE